MKLLQNHFGSLSKVFIPDHKPPNYLTNISMVDGTQEEAFEHFPKSEAYWSPGNTANLWSLGISHLTGEFPLNFGVNIGTYLKKTDLANNITHILVSLTLL